MNPSGNNNIPSSLSDDNLLTMVTENVCKDIRDRYLCSIPSTWDIECGTKKITYNDIREKYVEEGISPKKANEYYGLDSSIETDAHIIYLTMCLNGATIKRPLFLGEMKKQGTNDKRIEEGKKKQAIGNAAPDRVWKNFEIAAEYCYLSDKDFFPYNVFLHGCDFKEEDITMTTLAKLKPLFGKLNNFNPYFDKDIFWGLKGGCCYYQNLDYTDKQLYEYCYKCCEEGLKHYQKKYMD